MGNSTQKRYRAKAVSFAKQKELINKKNSAANTEELEDEIADLMDQKQELIAAQGKRDEFKKRIKEMESFLADKKEIAEFQEDLVRSYIKEIKIYEDRFEIAFKAGVSVDIAR